MKHRTTKGKRLKVRDLLSPDRVRSNLVEYLKDQGLVNPEACLRAQEKILAKVAK